LPAGCEAQAYQSRHQSDRCGSDTCPDHWQESSTRIHQSLIAPSRLIR
tara:strand:- start:128408 stop:128551 length:144 start_codon:yes stop_codon:yes gene_type:complete